MAKKKKTNPRKRPMTQYEMDKALKLAYEESVRQLSIITLTIAAMSVHDVFDVGPKRCERLVVDMIRKLTDMDEGWFTEDDSLSWFESYTGMKLEL